MKRPSKWTWIWIGWLAALVVLDILANRAKRPKPRTFSEHVGRWFRGRWMRVLFVGLMTLLTIHILSSGDVGPQYCAECP